MQLCGIDRSASWRLPLWSFGPQKTRHVVRSARLRARAGQTFTAEGLRADDRPDLIAVHIRIAHADAPSEAVGTIGQSCVQAERQAVAACVDRIDYRVRAPRREGRDMQYGAENFALDVLDTIHADRDGAEEIAFALCLDAVDQPSSVFGLRRVVPEVSLRGLVDDRTYVGFQQPRITNTQFVHCACQHRQQPIRDVFLHVENA